jgi:hypothetical protein
MKEKSAPKELRVCPGNKRKIKWIKEKLHKAEQRSRTYKRATQRKPNRVQKLVT